MKKIESRTARYRLIAALLFILLWVVPSPAFAKDAAKNSSQETTKGATKDDAAKVPTKKPAKGAKKDLSRQYFNALQQRLVKDGFDPQLIKKLYSDKKVFFESWGVSLYFLHNEATLDYNKMTKKTWIREGRVYMKENEKILKAAEKKFGVDPNVITAIILVETKFGRYVGTRSVINTLSTMASLTEAPPREYLWGKLPKERRYERNRYDQKADRKSKWAYRELKAFITYTQQHQVDAVSVKGSYAGAMGISQFMPSNILAYGKDGDGDGRIDLFQNADAIHSIASYLKHYGWKPGIDRKKAYKVVYHYNHSKYYVNTVLKISDLLKAKKGKA